jgi:hypothetical protein
MRLGRIGTTIMLAMAAAVGSTACAPNLAPVYAPAEAAGVTAEGTPYTSQQVEEAAAVGAQSKGWTIVQRAPGVVVAEISAGGHQARVRILCSAEGWRILHEQSSPGLQFGHDDEHGDVIHRRYNHWVRLLDESIRRALATQTSGAEATPTAAPPP